MSSPGESTRRTSWTPFAPVGRPVADIEVGHLSSTLPHLGNIVARTNRSVRFDPDREQIVGDEEANALLARRYRSWPLGRTQLRCKDHAFSDSVATNLAHGSGWKLRSEPQVGAEVVNPAEGQLAHPAGQREGRALVDPMQAIG